MISTIVANLYGVLRPVLLISVLLLTVVGWMLLRRGATGRRILGVPALVSVVAVLLLALTPDTATRAAQFCAVQAQLFTSGVIDLLNVMLLLPSALFTALWSRRFLPVFAAAAGLSAVIEVLQGALPLGRSCDTDDLITNMVGGSRRPAGADPPAGPAATPPRPMTSAAGRRDRETSRSRSVISPRGAGGRSGPTARPRGPSRPRRRRRAAG